MKISNVQGAIWRPRIAGHFDKLFFENSNTLGTFCGSGTIVQRVLPKYINVLEKNLYTKKYADIFRKIDKARV